MTLFSARGVLGDASRHPVSRFSVLCSFLPLLLLVLPMGNVQAMITVLDTGKRFASRQDKYYGPTIPRGLQHMARLQYVQGNMNLCPSPTQNNTKQLIPPLDGLPVALLVRSGGCTLREKLDYIKKWVAPAKLVRYLIVDSSSYMVEGSSSSNTAEDSEEILYLDGEEEEMVEAIQLGYKNLDSITQEDDEIKARERLERKNHPHRDQSVNEYILHVSSRTGFQLLDLLMQQSSVSYMNGGMRISMDGRVGTSSLQSSTALWIALSALMGACVCSFCLILSGTRTGWWDAPEPPAAPQPTRPQRRRLTKEQVKRLFPVYQYNGQVLEAIEETAPLMKDGEPENGDVLRASVPQPLDLSMCSICLDEYEPGDRIRCLGPCQHAFHAKCVGRWLSERSATCPLCKMELYDPEEEEEDSEDEEGEEEPQAPAAPESDNTSNLESALRFFSAFNTRQAEIGSDNGDEEAPPVVPIEEPQPGGESRGVVAAAAASPTPSATLELDDNASTVVEQQQRRPAWWRRMRRWITSPRNPSSMNITLTQPLLGGEVNIPQSPQQVVVEPNLMVPLESTIPASETTTAGDATTATTGGEEPIPDPPGEHVRQVTV